MAVMSNLHSEAEVQIVAQGCSLFFPCSNFFSLHSWFSPRKDVLLGISTSQMDGCLLLVE